MAKVVFRPSGKTIECEVGDNLLEVARRADVFIEAPCNGSKSCGKCKVKLLTGEVNQEVSSHLTDAPFSTTSFVIIFTKHTTTEVVPISTRRKKSSGSIPTWIKRGGLMSEEVKREVRP